MLHDGGDDVGSNNVEMLLVLIKNDVIFESDVT